MLSIIGSGTLVGVTAYFVRVEVDVSMGLPGITMVGFLSGETRESRERVQVALKNIGWDNDPTRITINLAPGDMRKDGTAFDLPIAVGILQSQGYFAATNTQDVFFLGELGLNGEIKPVRGVLPLVMMAESMGYKECIVPLDNAIEASVVKGIRIRPAQNLRDVVAYLGNPLEMDELLPAMPQEEQEQEKSYYDRDMGNVCGQEAAKRAAEIAAAGFHNMLLVGPPGAGKSMIAGCIPGILPPLTHDECLEVTSIYSVAGQLKQKLISRRPFQNPHHSISMPALLGGTINPRPGVISLAHRGVLFLDEFPEFNSKTIDSLRQPLEEGEVQVARMHGVVTFPANFMLVCAMNPCPCGFYPDTNRCRCTDSAIRRYMGKISGPILDRIDLSVEMKPLDIEALGNKRKNESSEDIRARVMKARSRQEHRFANETIKFNSEIRAQDIERFCPLGTAEQELMNKVFRSLGLSARSYHRVLKVARTIADLDDSEVIDKDHLLEAVSYRPATDYWQ